MVSIGNHVTISVRSVVIAHFAGSARWARLSDGASVRIEDNVYIGPGVIILPNVTIGQGAVVAAGSVVTQSVPPLTMVQGNPLPGSHSVVFLSSETRTSTLCAISSLSMADLPTEEHRAAVSSWAEIKAI